MAHNRVIVKKCEHEKGECGGYHIRFRGEDIFIMPEELADLSRQCLELLARESAEVNPDA